MYRRRVNLIRFYLGASENPLTWPVDVFNDTLGDIAYYRRVEAGDKTLRLERLKERGDARRKRARERRSPFGPLL